MRRSSPRNSAPSPEPTFSADDLLQSLCDLMAEQSSAAPGLTSREMAERSGLPQSRIMKLLHQAASAGRLESDRVMRRSIDGALRPASVYRIRPKAA